MLTKVKKWIDEHHLLTQGDKVLVACSGGPDSLALLYLLNQLRPEYRLYLAVAHVDHMFRGRESAEDAAFVNAFCRELGIECYQTAINVPEYSRKTGRSHEDAARFLRYAYLRATAEHAGISKIATGHHRDDQAETVLLNLLRGAGSSGLAGMQPKENGLIRPLLSISRQEIEAYCREHDLKPRFDSTNAKTDYTRNRIRLELLPSLELYNANIKAALCRTASLVGAEQDLIHRLALKIMPDLVKATNGKTLLNANLFAKEHLALQREILRSVLEKKRGHLKGITFYHVEQLLEMLLHKQVGSSIILPGGLVARKGYGTLELSGESPGTEPSNSIPYPGIELAVPGRTDIPELGLSVVASVSEASPKEHPLSAVFDLDALKLPIYVRTRREGDRFCPSGMYGHQKLKDFFINAKVLREERNKIPIFTDTLEIIWVGGYRRASYGKTGRLTKQFLQLTMIKQGDYLC